MGRNKNVKKAKMEFLEMGEKRKEKEQDGLSNSFDTADETSRLEDIAVKTAKPGRARRPGRGGRGGGGGARGSRRRQRPPHLFILSGFSSGVELPVSEQLCCVATSRCFRVRRYLLTPWDGNENSVLPASLPPTHSGPVPLPGVAMPVLR